MSKHDVSLMKRIGVAVAMALIVLLAPFGFSQQLTGSLSGTVYDQTGAVIPKAKIELKNSASGDVRNTVSDNSGYFSLSAVQPASYQITISADGFTTWQESGIAMSQGDSRTVANIKLKVGGAKTDVEVVSGADAVVPVDTSEVSVTLNQQMVNDIALQGRDAGELLKIMPGMALNNGLSQGSSFNPKVVGSNNGPVGAYSSNGTQPNGTMAFMLDGANLVDPGNFGTQIANINQDMTAEVKVLMASYTAEYAKGPVIFQAFSKSGGAQYHGEGYLYARNSTFNSIEAYTKSQISSKAASLVSSGVYTQAQANAIALDQALPDEHYYYMGGNVGGPIRLPFLPLNRGKKKLFFWGGYEYMDQHPAGSPINYNVPTPEQLGQDKSELGIADFTNADIPAAELTGIENNGNINYAYKTGLYNLPTNHVAAGTDKFPITDFDPNIQAVLKAGYYPQPNLTPNGTNGNNNYEYISDVPQNRWEGTGKIDYAISDNTKLTGSYTRQIENDQHPIAVWWAAPWTLPYPSPVVAATTSNLVMTNFTHVFNPTTTNEFVYTLARYINPSTLGDPGKVNRHTVGFNVTGLYSNPDQIPNLEGPWGGALPNISEESFGGEFDSGAFGGLKKAPALYDNFSKVIGSHSLKAGFYWDSAGDSQSSSGPGNGTYNLGWGGYGTGNVVADFLLGRIGNYQEQSSIPVYLIQFHQWSLYAQDSWKANNQLTLNYGLRFDHIGQWYGGRDGGGFDLGFQVWDPASYVQGPGTAAPPNTGIKWNAIDKAIPDSGFPSPLFYYSPRVGLAYDVFGTGRSVIRGGFAVFRYQLTSEVGGAWSGPQGSFEYTAGSPDGPLKADGTNLGYAGIDSLSSIPKTSEQNGASIAVMAQGDSRTPLTMDWNFTVSQALPWRSVFEVSYVANKSSNEYINGANGKYDDLNNAAPGSQFLPDPFPTSGNYGLTLSPSPPPCGTVTAGSNQSLYCVHNPKTYNPPASYNGNGNDWRPYWAYEDIYLLTHGSYASYNSIQASWQKQSGPVNFISNFTFGKAMGIWDGASDNGAGNGATVDPFNLKNNYGPLAYDHTFIFNEVYIWNLPKPLHSNGILAQLVNGWQLSGYSTYQSGAALQPGTGGNLNASYPGGLSVPTQQNPGLPDYSIVLPNGLRSNSVNTQTWFGSSAYNLLLPVANAHCNPSQHLKAGYYFNPQCFGPPAYGKQGTYEWPYMRGPGYFDSDLALFKNFRVTDNQKVQLRVSSTNFLNHPLRQFGLAGSGDEQLNFGQTVDDPTEMKAGCNQSGGNDCHVQDTSLSQYNTNTTTTGKPAFTTGQRTIEFALKYYF